MQPKAQAVGGRECLKRVCTWHEPAADRMANGGMRVWARPTFVARRRGTFHDVGSTHAPSSGLETTTGRVLMWSWYGFSEPWRRSLILHLPDSTSFP
eukprot:6682639-Prymnesium_polylepis.1